MPTALCVSLVALAACASLETTSLAPTAALASGPTVAEVRTRSGSVIRLRDPAVEGDSLVGWVVTGPVLDRSATALVDIERLSVPRPAYPSAGAAGVVLGASALYGVLLLLPHVLPSGT